MQSLFFNARRYDLGRVGRYKLNKRLGLDPASTDAHADPGRPGRHRQEADRGQQHGRQRHGADPQDDIDHLGNRRVRAVGELLQNQFRIGLLRMERVVKERMTIQDAGLGHARAR